MIKTYSQLIDELNSYKNPKMKIQRLVKNKTIFFIAKGLYETNENVDPFYLANALYSPSYISFETALSFFDLIPERTYAITNATFKKNKTKQYNTKFGLFTYSDVPHEAFPLAVNYFSDGDYMYRIALKEKALLDYLYKVTPVIKTKKEMRAFLFENMRINEIILETLDKQLLIELRPHYHSTTINLFVNMFLKGDLYD